MREFDPNRLETRKKMSYSEIEIINLEFKKESRHQLRSINRIGLITTAYSTGNCYTKKLTSNHNFQSRYERKIIHTKTSIMECQYTTPITKKIKIKEHIKFIHNE